MIFYSVFLGETSNVHLIYFPLFVSIFILFSTKENPNEVVTKFKNIIQHVHIGDKNLKEPGLINNGHRTIGNALKKINYSNYLSIEMRKPANEVKKVIKRSILYVKENYNSTKDEK